MLMITTNDFSYLRALVLILLHVFLLPALVCCVPLNSIKILSPFKTFSPHCAAWLGVSGGTELGRSQAEPAAPSSAPWVGGAAGQPGKNLLCQSWAQNHTVATTHSAVRLLPSPQKTYQWLFMCTNTDSACVSPKQGQWFGGAEKTEQ